MEYLLRHKEKDVALIEFSETGNITSIKEVIDQSHFPLSIVREDGKISIRRLIEWWGDRGIPVTREGYREALRELGTGNKAGLLMECNGLSLTDHYWVAAPDDTKKWKDVNFYENSFNNDIGNLFFGIRKKDRKYSRTSPDAASDGDLRKRWIIEEDGTRSLLKGGRKPYLQEPCNEVIASLFCERLRIPHTAYTLQGDMNDPVSRCANMTSGDVEFVDAASVYATIEPGAFGNGFYSHYRRCTEKLKVKNIVPMLDRMIVLDYLILNHDRHFRNFGILRNSTTLADSSPCPIFDSGSSLYHEDGKMNIVLPEKAKAYTKCFDDLDKQLDLVEDWTWYGSARLERIGEECGEILSKVPSIEKERIEKIVSVIEKRIALLDVYIGKNIAKGRLRAGDKRRELYER